MFYHVANIGDTRSLAIHPATTTHSQLDPHELDATGVTDGYVRLSVGIEHIDDIIADIERGLVGGGQSRQGGVIVLSARRRESGGLAWIPAFAVYQNVPALKFRRWVTS